MLNSSFRFVNIKDSINYRNYNTSKNKNQHSKKIFSYPVSIDPVEEIYNISENEREVFSYFVGLANNFKKLYPSQKTIGESKNLCRKTVNKYVGTLCQRGFIQKKNNFKSTNDYILSPYFDIIAVRQALAPLIKAFRFIPFSALVTTILHTETISKTKVTRVINPFVYIKSLSNWISKGGGLSTKKVVKNLKNHVSHRKRKGFLMNNLIIPEILGIKSITMLEKIQLSAFPKEAIIYALKMLPKGKELKSVFCWLRFVCKDYCKLHELEPDYQWATQMEAAYKSNPKQFDVLKPSQSSKTTSQSYPLGPQKREGGSNLAKDHEVYVRFLAKKKAFVQSLPPASEEIMKSMTGFFPGTPEEMNEVIAKEKGLRSLSSVIDKLSTTANHRQTVDSSPLPDYNDAEYTNEDDPQSNIWEFAL